MRIIGGKLKNKKLCFPENLKTRPLKDSVRENIFNILTHSNKINIDIESSDVLDLYAGTGSFGLECISRGSYQSTFVENNSEALKKLKVNIKDLNLENKTTICKIDVLEFFDKPTMGDYREKFNIIFLDPPYQNREFLEIIKLLKKKILLKKNHVIIIHREVNSKDNLNKYLSIFEKRVYGRSEIFFGKLI